MLVERKVCFILDASNWGWGGEGGQLSKGQLPSTDNQWARAFIDIYRGRGLHAETAHSSVTVVLKLVIDGLTAVILIASSTDICSSMISLFSFSWGQFLELWQLMSWLQSSHNVGNLFHPVSISVSVRQLTGYGSGYYLLPLRRN